MNIKHILVVAPLALAAVSAWSQVSGTFKVGLTQIQPHSSSSDISGSFTPSGLSLDVRSASTLFLSYSRPVTEHWSWELAAGLPPTHDVNIVVHNSALPASVQAYNGQVGARARQIAPTLFANYNFGAANSQIRPFVGVGVNYTSFDKVDSTSANNALNGGVTSLSLSDSWGLAAQVGVNLKVNDKWSLSAALATAKVKTQLSSNTLGITRSADITLRPAVFTLALGYSF